MKRHLSRRHFLGIGAGAALGLATGCSSSEESDPGPDLSAGLLEEARRPDGIFEIFMLGGMSPWETFYVVPEHGDPSKGGKYAGSQWWTFHDQGPLTIDQYWSTCGPQSGGELLTPYSADAEGRTVNLGPFVHPLRNRPDMLARMRVWVMGHTLGAHEAAVPLGITGHPLGNPRMAALGTHYQAHFGELSPRTEPWAYTLYMSSLDIGNNGTAASAVGLHRASARPLAVQLGADVRLPEQLPRPNVAGFKGELDQTVEHYVARYRQQLSLQGRAVRAPAFDDFVFSRSSMRGADALTGLITAERVRSDPRTMCIPHPLDPQMSPTQLDETTTGIRLGTSLLTDPATAARYVQLMDAGIFTDPAGQGYDSHANHVQLQGPNVAHTLTQLAERVNRPGENDPSKLDLDRHFVLLNTEFGRSPSPEFTVRNPDGTGTDHWPYGYVIVGFGGFVGPEQAGVVGAIGEDGIATDFVTPAEHRAAMLQAMGIWPFTERAFAVGDVRTGEDELEAAINLKTRVLGA